MVVPRSVLVTPRISLVVPTSWQLFAVFKKRIGCSLVAPRIFSVAPRRLLLGDSKKLLAGSKEHLGGSKELLDGSLVDPRSAVVAPRSELVAPNSVSTRSVLLFQEESWSPQKAF